MILKDKVIIITGVGPGMGQAMAKIAAQEGAKVVVAARTRSFLDEVVAEIEGAGGQALAVPTDVGDKSQCEKLAAETVRAFGRIDGLVNSAYITGETASLEAADVDSWLKVLDIGCLAAVRMSQAVVPSMKAQGGGAIVNIGSMQALKHLPGSSLSYAVAKGAIITASRQLASELGPLNIRVNAVRMGWLWGAPVKAALAELAAHSGLSEEEMIASIAEKIPLRVIPPEEECARTALMFLSDYTRMATGAVVDVNGGEWMAP